eukprot:TRINITY_DN3958_c0_g1_i1.p1 TRINITY_DN3958_c0_g1~~TRINITY_DN3958_c0_g1_i1.p1  ORF type:complete len:497 (-),score=80.77 TRINITY_DN3958_c0_g1_i1:777-2267(-)
MSNKGFLTEQLTKKTSILGLRLWVWIAIGVGAIIFLILVALSIWLSYKRRSRGLMKNTQIPKVSKEIKEVKIDISGSNNGHLSDHSHDKSSEKALKGSMDADKHSQGSSTLQSEEEGSSCLLTVNKTSAYNTASPLVGLPETAHLGWGHWFTLRDLENATNNFSKENVLGEGGYGIVYKGKLPNGTMVAVKNVLNNLGQAEKEFRVEVEAIGHVRHKHLVRLLGYCVEGTHRMLVYEYVNNGNLEQWLHGAMGQGYLTWEARMKVITGTAKALAYLHEAIEPKVVHRDIKASNILMDKDFNAKISDFGLAKLLGSEKSHITTRVMGTFGYVAPEYANTGLLNEKSDIYSFGVLLLETITGRDPVDNSRPADEVFLVEWLKTMIANRRSEEVIDPHIVRKPSTRDLKRALLVALRCVDPDSEKRPRMGQVVRMLEADELPFREEHRRKVNHGANVGVENQSRGGENSATDASLHRNSVSQRGNTSQRGSFRINSQKK